MSSNIWLADFACSPTWRDAAELLVEATVGVTGDSGFESFPSEDLSPGARLVATAFASLLHEKHPDLAIAWDVLAWDGSTPAAMRTSAQMLIDVVVDSKMPGIPRAQAIGHLRVWRKLARDDFK